MRPTRTVCFDDYDLAAKLAAMKQSPVASNTNTRSQIYSDSPSLSDTNPVTAIQEFHSYSLKRKPSST
jgi:hypothetical protein